MSTLSPRRQGGVLLHAGLALVAAVIVVAVLAGFNERLGIDDTVAFWGLFLVGVALCGAGPLGQGAAYGWWNPLHIAGYLLGVALVLLGVAVLFEIALPGIATVQAAIVIVAGLMVVKGVLAMFYRRPA